MSGGEELRVSAPRWLGGSRSVTKSQLRGSELGRRRRRDPSNLR